MEARNKKMAAVLAALVVLWAVLAYALFFRHEKQPEKAAPDHHEAVTADKQPARAKAKDKEGEASITTPIKVDLGLLKGKVEAYKAGRNIFNPVYRKPVIEKPGKKGGPITVAPLPPPPPPPPPRSEMEIAADNAKEEINKVKVLGLLKRKSRTDVFLSLGNDTYIAAKGDTITRGYYLKDVGKDFVVIADKGTGVEVKLSTNFEAGKGASNTVPSPGMGGGAPSGGPQPPQPMGGGGPGQRHMNPPPGTQPGHGSGMPAAPYSTPYTPATTTTTEGGTVTTGTTTTTTTPSTTTTTTTPSTTTTTTTTTVPGGTEPEPLTGHSLF